MSRDDEKDPFKRPLSLVERMILKVMVAGQTAQFGFAHPFMENIVRTSGVRGSLAFMRDIGKTVGAIEKHFGPLVGNLVMGFSGLWNGCPYCGVGHIYALNIVYFKMTGLLYPISERDVVDLQNMPYEESMAYARNVLSASDELVEHYRVVERLFQLYTGETPKSEEDKILSAALGAWGWLNECSIPITYDMQIEEIPAIIPEKDRKGTIHRYRAARDAHDHAKAVKSAEPNKA